MIMISEPYQSESIFLEELVGLRTSKVGNTHLTALKLIQCPTCPQRFTLQADLNTHLKLKQSAVHPNGTYKCHFCPKRFFYAEDLAEHKCRYQVTCLLCFKAHIPGLCEFNLRTCKSCKKPFKILRSLANASRQKCDQCTKINLSRIDRRKYEADFKEDIGGNFSCENNYIDFADCETEAVDEDILLPSELCIASLNEDEVLEKNNLFINRQETGDLQSYLYEASLSINKPAVPSAELVDYAMAGCSKSELMELDGLVQQNAAIQDEEITQMPAHKAFQNYDWTEFFKAGGFINSAPISKGDIIFMKSSPEELSKGINDVCNLRSPDGVYGQQCGNVTDFAVNLKSKVREKYWCQLGSKYLQLGRLGCKTSNTTAITDRTSSNVEISLDCDEGLSGLSDDGNSLKNYNRNGVPKKKRARGNATSSLPLKERPKTKVARKRRVLALIGAQNNSSKQQRKDHPFLLDHNYCFQGSKADVHNKKAEQLKQQFLVLPAKRRQQRYGRLPKHQKHTVRPAESFDFHAQTKILMGLLSGSTDQAKIRQSPTKKHGLKMPTASYLDKHGVVGFEKQPGIARPSSGRVAARSLQEMMGCYVLLNKLQISKALNTEVKSKSDRRAKKPGSVPYVLLDRIDSSNTDIRGKQEQAKKIAPVPANRRGTRSTGNLIGTSSNSASPVRSVTKSNRKGSCHDMKSCFVLLDRIKVPETCRL